MHDHRSTVKDVGGFLQSADLMNRAFRPTVAAMLMSKTCMLSRRFRRRPAGGRWGCGSTPKKAEMVSDGPNVPPSPLVDRAKCNDKDKHVVTADTNADKKPDVVEVLQDHRRRRAEDRGDDLQAGRSEPRRQDRHGQLLRRRRLADRARGDRRRLRRQVRLHRLLQPEQARARRDRHELRSARRRLEVLRGREAGPRSRTTGTTTARSTSGSTTRAASSIASATTPAARAGSTSGTARPRSRKKRRAATPRPRAEQPLRAASRRPAARPPHRRPPRRPRPAAPPPRPRSPRRPAAKPAAKAANRPPRSGRGKGEQPPEPSANRRLA